MRFNDNDYLKAFPRENRVADVKSEDEPGNVLDHEDPENVKDPEGEAADGDE